MPMALGIGLGVSFGGIVQSGAAAMLGSYPSGVAVSFLDNSMSILDSVTPANNYVGQPFSKLSGATRASSGTYINSAGLLTTALTNVPRFDYNPITLAPLGVLLEPAATNLALQSNDLTNAAWVKTNMTAALTKIGPDGIVNSATLLTATAANATVLQTITQASAAFIFGSYVERVTGSGAISMTMDGGTTWTVISPTAPWAKFAIPTQTLANPNFGFRIATSGDQIAVYGSQLEAGTISTSTIVTTGATATRAADSEATLASSLFNLSSTAMTLFVDVDWNGGTSQNVAGRAAMAVDDGSTTNRVNIYNSGGSQGIYDASGGVGQVTTSTGIVIANGVRTKSAFSLSTSAYGFSVDAAASLTGSAATFPVGMTRLAIGNAYGSALNGHIARIMYLPQTTSNANLPVMSGTL